MTAVRVFDSESLSRVLFEDIGPAGGGGAEMAKMAKTKFALAYSGGRDSQVLLHALCAVRRELGFDLTALHFDHGLAPQSADWARQCEAVCRQWEVAFISDRQPLLKSPGESLEALARQSRYRWFEQVVKPGQVLLTAHHANDQAETVLLNLLRGGGVQSLAGIPQQRVLSLSAAKVTPATPATRVVRPLLSFSREALAEYARRHELTWIDDPSNLSLQFDRNYLRESIIPLLEQRWPGAINSLGRSAENCREVAAFLDEVMTPLLQRCQVAEKSGVFCLAPPLDGSALKPLGRFQIIALMRCWIHRHGRRSPSSGQLATLFRQVFEDQKMRAGVRWDAAELRYFDGHLHLIRRLDAPPDGPLEWDLRARDLGTNGVRLEVRKGAGGTLDPQRLRGKSLKLVWRTGGERMFLPGRTHSSALKKLFQQNAVPPWERRALPLLVVDGEVAWAHGVGAAACCCAQNQAGIRLRYVAGGD